ncbi:hypothetical protein AQUCO_00400299v1 [Aquilegia coerulea]|uniref:TF-B3 domain-containing protein n=1 Tax=Aquilegia coerulea TaxID=218851 RepID=A0A2G5EUI4_AQUCA|nr:hypothetical protein AQUCO_00400299v1 [Aquilegia coerulea]
MAWQVELKKIDGSVYLQNGWLEFVDHHSICAGHVLVFRYNRKSRFDVLIFDMSCSEIDYLCNSKKIGQFNHMKDTLVPKKEAGDITIGKTGSLKRDLVRKRRVETEERTGNILQRATTFKTKHHFFKVFMRPSYVKSRYVPMPVRFYDSHLKGLNHLTLQASNGIAKWHVRCLSGSGHMRMTGVAAFIVESNIKVGNICFFQLINKEKGVLKVNICSEE